MGFPAFFPGSATCHESEAMAKNNNRYGAWGAFRKASEEARSVALSYETSPTVQWDDASQLYAVYIDDDTKREMDLRRAEDEEMADLEMEDIVAAEKMEDQFEAERIANLDAGGPDLSDDEDWARSAEDGWFYD